MIQKLIKTLILQQKLSRVLEAALLILGGVGPNVGSFSVEACGFYI